MANLSNIFRGDSQSYTFTFTDKEAKPIDISAWTVWLTFKDDINDSDEDAVIQKVNSPGSHSDSTAGKTSFILTAEDTNTLQGKYYYDVQVKKGDGGISTVRSGFLLVKVDVTRSTS
jgi:hypothetical protein